MPDTPLAVRVNDETRALFNELAERSEFENKGDFLNRLLIQFQAEKMKDNVSMLRPAIEAVETLTSRLLDVLNGAGAIIATKDETHQQALDEQRLSFESTRGLLQQRVDALQQESIEAEERGALLLSERKTAEAKVAELQQRIEQLEGAAADKDALIAEYKDKNDTLSSIISEYKTAAAENKTLNESVNNYKQENESLQRQLDELRREQQRQAGAHTAELDNLRTSLQLQKDAALLELRQELQAKAEAQQERHATVVSEYQAKIENFLLEREASVPKVPSKRAPRKVPAAGQGEEK